MSELEKEKSLSSSEEKIEEEGGGGGPHPKDSSLAALTGKEKQQIFTFKNQTFDILV